MTPIPMTIDGLAVISDDSILIANPATGEDVGYCPVATAAQVEQAIQSSKRAFATWSQTSDAQRKSACHAMADILDAHSEELAHLLTLEQGKPLNGMGSRFELGGASAWTRYAADFQLTNEIIQDDAEAQIILHRKPVGVVAAITPWNWPLMIAIWHLVPAIRTGNTVVIKPSPFTPLSTLKMVALLNSALPPGVLNVVVGHDDIGPMLTSHLDIAKVVFTGSSATGRKVMQSGAETLKRLTLELGGNDAGIVLPDAVPAEIAERLFWGAFINNGQTCAALKRLYVHDSIYDVTCAALVAFAKTVNMGTGLDENSLLGPIQNAAQLAKVTSLVDQAKADGAQILIGGTPSEGPGYFYPITLVANATEGMAIVDQEQFGPALPIIRYHDVDDAIRRANASEFGLGASVWSSDPKFAHSVAIRLESGTVWINQHGTIRPDTPFGGVKSSGLGVEFGRQGMEDYTTIQAVHS